MITNLKELIRLCKDEVHDREYHAHHANALTSEWDAVSQWFDDNGIHEFNRDNAFAYCDEVIGSHIIVKGMTKKQKKSLRAIRMLLSYQESGDFEFRTPRVEYLFPGNTGKIILLYLQHERDLGRSEKTINYRRMALCSFNNYLFEKGLGFEELGIDIIEDYYMPQQPIPAP